MVDYVKIAFWLVFIIFYLCVALVGPFDDYLSLKGVNDEVVALMLMKDGCDGWDINSIDPCTWNMVSCFLAHFVIFFKWVYLGSFLKALQI